MVVMCGAASNADHIPPLYSGRMWLKIWIPTLVQLWTFSSGMHNSRAVSSVQGVMSGPRSGLKKYKKFLLNDGYFMNEFKLR